MTQKELIDHCNIYDGLCEDCPHEETCYRYQDKYVAIPWAENKTHPERYTDDWV